MLITLKQWARNVKRDVHAVYLAARDTRVPWYVKLLAIGVAAYALSPIDMIPDFIPVVGPLDDAVIVPLGVLLVVSLIPAEIMAEHRAAAAAAIVRPVSKTGAIVIIGIWVSAAMVAGLIEWRYWTSST